MRIFFTIFFLLSMGSCTGPEDKPEGVLDRDEFVKVLIDIHVADAHVSHLLGRDFDAKDSYYTYYKEVFEEYGISRDEFAKTFDYYGKQNDEMFKIYEEVLDSIQMRKARIKPLLQSRVDTVSEE